MNADEPALDPGSYCREIESYLCRKNGGHVIRVVGPAFGLVAGWARQGIPLKVVFRGIDRRVERHAAGPSAHRPLRIEFCEADVQSVFREWRRAVGMGLSWGSGLATDDSDATVESGDQSAEVEQARASSGARSLPDHLRRVIDRLAMIDENGARPRALDAWIAETVSELGRIEAVAAKLRGVERNRVLHRLRGLDADMLALMREHATPDARDEADRSARRDLQPFVGRIQPDALASSIEQAATQYLREALKLPVIAFD